MFAEDPHRVETWRRDAAGLSVDISRHFIDRESLTQLLGLIRAQGWPGARERLFAGEPVNHTESRAALHMALRASKDRDWRAEGEPVSEAICHELKRLEAFTRQVHAGELKGATGKRFRHVINIGIGGSHLGPELVVTALDTAPEAPDVHFLSNVDPAQARRVLAPLDPAETLVLVVSKSFTTRETLSNANRAKAWLCEALGEKAIARHFVAISTNAEAVARFGVAPEQQFGFWDWVGGRYSVWSAVGLAAMLHLGPKGFRELLAGAADMDTHFEKAPDEDNIPLLLGLIDAQYISAFGWHSWAVIPYSDRLRQLPSYLQQLVMESNGKGVDSRGNPVSASSPVLLGGTGTDAQHSFFQMFHQGPNPVPVDFILAREPDIPEEIEAHHQLVASCLGQMAALANGREPSSDAVMAPHQACPGNRPSGLILMDRVTPRNLGALVALYEHRTFVQSLIWGINPYDQMGVELGKQVATGALGALDSGQTMGDFARDRWLKEFPGAAPFRVPGQNRGGHQS
ncbi:glucose-6-phosphate isomerase [Natronospira proteinivora]|uniref:Glucose-6-phosphate isomerase n=2 Tax=Natronospira proteinivora TaxID=1807133 RepID=A0ABT1G9A6_9GAMM|nr:glucose-6-phosphate isomerase [Natronospira proteinivora]